MDRKNIQQVFDFSYEAFATKTHPTGLQHKTARAISACKSGELGCNIRRCQDCSHQVIHNNSCRNRNCPSCQAVLKERWVDARKAEVIEAPYFHVVFTLPAELRSLVYMNQKELYSLLHSCTSETLLELSKDKKYLGATPGIVQVLHTWGQELNFHPHIHCIISGAGLSSDLKLIRSKAKFFIPIKVLGKKFRGKFLNKLHKLYETNQLSFSNGEQKLRNHYEWSDYRNQLYKKDWIPYIKETFNGFGNAIEYLGRYTHKIAISNSRIKSVTEKKVSFTARDYRTGENKVITLENEEFIRRFLQHVLPSGFHRIRYYGFLNNRSKKKNLQLLFKIIGKRQFSSLFSNMPMEELLFTLWNLEVRLCPECGGKNMCLSGRTFRKLE